MLFSVELGIGSSVEVLVVGRTVKVTLGVGESVDDRDVLWAWEHEVDLHERRLGHIPGGASSRTSGF